MIPISEELRWEIVSAWKAGESAATTAKRLGISCGAVYKWVQRYQATGTVSEKPKSGRPRAIGTLAAQRAVHLLLKGRNTADRAAQLLHQEGHTSKPLHRSTLIRAATSYASKSGITLVAYRGKPIRQLTADTKQKRLDFAKANLGRQWDNVMFTDRKKFLFHYPGTQVMPTQWVEKGNKPKAFKPTHPQGLNVYAGITKFGATICHVVAGSSKHKSKYTTKAGKPAKNITTKEYEEVLTKTLLPEGRRIFRSRGMTTWVLQQDNDPSHKEAPSVVEKWSKQQSCNTIVLPKWPPNSPDLNPIENLWAIVAQLWAAKLLRSSSKL
jgi:transposase